MTLRARFSALSRRQRLAFFLGVAIALYGLAGFLLVPYLIRTRLPPLLAETLGRPVSVRGVSLNPFALALAVQGFRVDDTDGEPLVRFHGLRVNVQMSSIFRRALTLKEIRLDAPAVRLRVLPDGKLSFADIMERLSADKPATAPAEPEDPFPVIVFRAVIDNGRVAIRDETRRTVFEEEIAPIDIALNDFTTLPDSDSRYAFTAVTESGASLTWEGSLSAIPLRSAGEIRLTEFRSRTPWRYLRDDLNFEIGSGTAGVSAKYVFDGAAKPPQLTVSEAALNLQNVTVFEEGITGPRLVLPRLDVTGGSLDLAARRVRIASVKSNGLRITMLREADGSLRLIRVLNAPDAPVEAGANEPVPAPAEPAIKKDPPAESEWKFTVDEIRLADYAVDFRDASTPEPARIVLAPVSVEVDGLSIGTPDPARLKVDVTFEKGGRLVTEGSLGLSPVSAELAVALTDFALPTLQPYVGQVSGLALRNGHLSTDLQVAYAAPTGGKPLTCTGDLRLTALDVGGRDGEDLLTLAELALDDLSVAIEPTVVSIAKLDLVEPRIRIARRADGTTNVQAALTSSSEPPSDQSPPNAGSVEPPSDDAASPAISLPSISLRGGSVVVTDDGLPSRFNLTLDELAGDVRGFSTSPDARVEMKLTGKIARTGSLQIDANLLPLAERPDGKLHFVLKNMDMTGFSPYSGKFVGQEISKGKLGLDLDYVVSRAKLTAENKVGLDAFTLGKPVESADATDLPVGLALALLRDASGRIALDVPVSGRIDDPEFRIGKVVLQTLRNMILKAATAPFALLGGLIGGSGDELGRVAFAPGRAEVSEAETAKLDTLAKALTERPTLNLEVSGATAADLDTPALGELMLEARLKALRFDEIRKRSDAPASATDLVLEEKHYERLLVEAYEATSGHRVRDLRREAPTSAEGEPELDLDLWVTSEMKRRLIAAAAVGDAELTELATRRADAIVRALVEIAKLPSERVFVTAPNAAASTESEAVLVELKLTPA